MKYLLNSFKNKIDFFIRQKLKFSRKNYNEKPESKIDLFSGVSSNKEQELLNKYELDGLKNNSTKLNYLENLYFIDILDKYLNVDFKTDLKILDIGCKNWSVSKAEYFFFKKYCEKLLLDGIELDASRLNTNLYSRQEVAKFHIKALENTRFIAGDFLCHNEKYDYMIWGLPFVSEYPLIKWGLPGRYFKPTEMLQHAYAFLNPEGKIFIVNQGENEYKTQKELCEKVGLKYNDIGHIQSEFNLYKKPRYIIIIEKQLFF